MPKNKLKDSFYWLGKNGQECNVDLSSERISRYINEAKNRLKKVSKGKGDFCYIAGKEALVIGVVNEEGERSIFVARDYFEADYVPGCGWIKVEDEDEIS
jgi:hypothetical protein